MTFSDEIIQRVWEKGEIIFGQHPDFFRKDACGAIIARNMYGDRSDQYNYGWEIDHIVSVTNGGSNYLSNLRLLHCYTNASKQDGRLSCPVTSR